MENLKVTGETPLPRFGHTITLISKTKAVLFGGATGDTGKYTITGETYIFDCITKKWRKIEPLGSQPTQRAAHSATSVELNQLVIYGGATGGGGLAPDDLYLLDLRSGEENAQWIVVPVVGTTPGRRYGHSLVFCKPYLLVFGGNTGNEPVNDVWCLNVEKAPFYWTKLECDGDAPLVRVYHSAALCSTGTANGMMVVFGGRTADQSALNDTWGLRRHRDGRWDWVKAPYKPNIEMPTCRYQHSTIFIASLMLVIGGRTNNVGETVPLEVYDTESSDWFKFPPIQRFRHSCWLLETALYIHGGFEQESPNIPTDTICKVEISKIFQAHPNLLKACQNTNSIPPSNQDSTVKNLGNSGSGGGGMGVGMQGTLGGGGMGASNQSSNLQPNKNILNKQTNEGGLETMQTTNFGGGGGGKQSGMGQDQNSLQPSITMGGSNSNNINNKPKPRQPIIQNRNVRLSDQVFAAMQWEDDTHKTIKRIALDKLPEEAKKLGSGGQIPTSVSTQHSQYYESIYTPFIQNLLKPKDWVGGLKWDFKKDLMCKLIDEAQKVLSDHPIVLTLRPPLKIFGNIHGQFSDLLRFFELFGSPTDVPTEGDIESFDYLFLGNYVDRGKYSLETIFLLLALKVKYPEQLHLLRGNHEDKKINSVYGFADECKQRLGEDVNDPNSIYQRLNRLFEYLPLAALIEEKILCVHGGIGSTLKSWTDIEKLDRPAEVVQEANSYHHQILLDILWSDPVLNENDPGAATNTARETFGGNVVRFGLDRLRKFLMENQLSFIIRSHECVMDGFDKFGGGQLITVFSCTDYCGKFQNAAAVLIIKKNCEMMPKVIYPVNSMTGGGSGHYLDDDNTKKSQYNNNKPGMSYGGNSGMGHSGQSTWMDNEELKKRPATPPRITSSKSLKK